MLTVRWNDFLASDFSGRNIDGSGCDFGSSKIDAYSPGGRSTHFAILANFFETKLCLEK
jgi:hypothetical protein